MMTEWTTQLPAQDGFYWIRNYTINCYPNKPQWNEAEPVPTIVEISANSFSFIGCDSRYYANELLSAEWYGPIQPPDKPTSFRGRLDSLPELQHPEGAGNDD